MAEALAALDAVNAPHALIGGLALGPHKVIRATQDIDLLADAGDANRIEAALLKLGYQRLHRSADAANYVRGDERLDLLYAHRPIARRLLANALTHHTSFGPLRVVSAEGLIGLKLQALVNNPNRSRDLDDIRELLAANQGRLELSEIREYFALFGREEQLDELLQGARL